jgi:hypothetical protein
MIKANAGVGVHGKSGSNPVSPEKNIWARDRGNAVKTLANLVAINRGE